MNNYSMISTALIIVNNMQQNEKSELQIHRYKFKQNLHVTLSNLNKKKQFRRNLNT